MTALLLKDLRLLRPWWWLIIPGYALFAANGIVHPELFFWVNVILGCSFTVGLLLLEWKQESEPLVASLPVDRGTIVAARYAGAVAAAVWATVIYWAVGQLLFRFERTVVLDGWPDTPGWLTTEGLLAFFLTVILVSLAFLPFSYRWGMAKGAWTFAAVALSGGAVVTWLVRRALVEPGDLRPSELLTRALASLSGVTNPVMTTVVVLAGAAVLGWASYRLSTRLYEGRDL